MTTSGVAESRGTPAAETPDVPFALRVAAVVAATCMPVARIVAPGMRGNAPHAVVEAWQAIAAVASYLLALALGALSVMGAAGLMKRDDKFRGLRGLVVTGAFVTMALVAPAFARRLPSSPAIVLVLASGVVVLAAAARAIGVARTRAVAIVLALFGLAALVRLFGWQLAVAAGEQVSNRLYTVSRVIASLAVILEAMGQLAAVAWLGTRHRITSQVVTSVAVVLGFALTWGATLGVHHDAAPWQAVLHTALLEAPGLPAPFQMSAVATFLFAVSFPLAIVAAFQRGEDAYTSSVLALALVSHGAFDAPMRALAAVAAAIALMATLSQSSRPAPRPAS